MCIRDRHIRKKKHRNVFNFKKVLMHFSIKCIVVEIFRNNSIFAFLPAIKPSCPPSNSQLNGFLELNLCTRSTQIFHWLRNFFPYVVTLLPFFPYYATKFSILSIEHLVLSCTGFQHICLHSMQSCLLYTSRCV